MYRKAGSRPDDNLDRLLGDAETLDAAARVDRTGEILLDLPKISKPKSATFFTLPWIDTPNIAKTQLPKT